MPASQRKRLVDCVSHGEPPKKRQRDVETIRFIINNFADTTEEGISSDPLFAHGIEWEVKVYPRGNPASNDESSHISVYLSAFGLLMKGDYSVRCGGIQKTLEKDFCDLNGDPVMGSEKFCKRKDALNYLLEDGSLVIEVDMRISVKGRKSIWYPEELKKQDFLTDLYVDSSEDVSAVVFSVEESTYRVHKCVLRNRAKKLYEFATQCSHSDSSSDKPILITSLRGKVFQHILEFVYTIKAPEIESEDVAVDLLVAADRFELVQLKLFVESVLVDKFLEANTAANLLVLADSHSCALLKEEAINLIVLDSETVRKTEGWSKIKDSPELLEELFTSLSTYAHKMKTGEIPDTGNDETDEFKRWTVSEIREELRGSGLEVDGSREVLVRRLAPLYAE